MALKRKETEQTYFYLESPHFLNFRQENANQALEKAWTLGDAGIQALEVNNGTHWSLRSGSIFINPVLEAGFRKGLRFIRWRPFLPNQLL